MSQDINYNDVYLYQKFLDILNNETKAGDVIWYTTVEKPNSMINFTYTINDEIREYNRAKRSQFSCSQSNDVFSVPTRIVFDKIIVNENTLNYIKERFGHDETGECKRRKLYGY